MNSEIWYYLYVCSRIHLCMWCLYIYLQVSMPMHAHMEAGEHLPLLRSTFAFEAGSPTETGAHSLLRLAGQWTSYGPFAFTSQPQNHRHVLSCPVFYMSSGSHVCSASLLPTEPSPQFLRSKAFLYVNTMSQVENSTPALMGWITAKTQVL